MRPRILASGHRYMQLPQAGIGPRSGCCSTEGPTTRPRTPLSKHRCIELNARQRPGCCSTDRPTPGPKQVPNMHQLGAWVFAVGDGESLLQLPTGFGARLGAMTGDNINQVCRVSSQSMRQTSGSGSAADGIGLVCGKDVKFLGRDTYSFPHTPSTTTRIARECQGSCMASIIGSLPRLLWSRGVRYPRPGE